MTRVVDHPYPIIDIIQGKMSFTLYINRITIITCTNRLSYSLRKLTQVISILARLTMHREIQLGLSDKSKMDDLDHLLQWSNKINQLVIIIQKNTNSMSSYLHSNLFKTQIN